ncbi:MAG: InlB B-repeat-containing protein [Agathobacter sp.]|nr:InlB B-repeat-containing protein [Agathobacter sp.]
MQNKKWISLALLLFVIGLFVPDFSETYQAATSYTNAKEFYESTSQNKVYYHAEVVDGTVYYATYAKLASSSTNLKYATVGFDITLSGNGHTVSFAIERYGNSITMVSQVNSGGYQYDLYAVEDKELYRLAQAVDPNNAAYVLDASVIDVRIDTIMVTKRANIPNGGITENGYGGISKWGTIYRLKNDSDLNDLKSIFTGHEFKSYREIKESLNNYKLQIRYAANGTNEANTNASSAVSVGNGFRVVNYTENGVKIPYVLYANGGLYATSSRVLQAMTLLKPSTAAMDKAGYHLITDKEWVTEDGKVLSANKSYMPREIAPEVGFKDIKIYLYANWKPNTYTIEYDANGGSGRMNTVTHIYDKEQALAKNTFTRTGYTFMGWARTPDGAVDFTDGQTVENLTSANGGKVTLYAVWQKNVYEITLDDDGADTPGSGIMYEGYEKGFYSDENATSSITGVTKPQKTGYTFGGYFDAKNGGGVSHIDGNGTITASNTAFKQDRTIYAKWTANTYTIRYHVGIPDAGLADTAATYDKDALLRPNVYTRRGYTFMGWARTEGGVVVYADKAAVKNITSVNGAVIDLYAVWEPVTAQITLNPQEGSGGTGYFYEKYGIGFYSTGLLSDVISRIIIPSRMGYDFKGYFTDVMGNGSVQIDAKGNILAKNTVFLQDTTLFAKWRAKTFAIVFDKQGGSYGTDSVTATYDHLIPEAQAPGKTGFTFAGYYTGKEGEETLYYDAYMNPQIIYKSVMDTVLYAHWIDDIAPEIILNVSHSMWTNQQVTLEAIARDRGSGLSKLEIFQILDDGSLTSVASIINLNGVESKKLTFENTTEGVIRYKAVATDKRGNVSECYNTVYYDETAPSGEVIEFSIDGTSIYIDVNVTDINPGD